MSDTPLSLEEQRLIAQREKWREERAERRRARQTAEHRQADEPPADGAIAPPMPAGLAKIRKWLRGRHDAYEAGKITSARLTEARRSASSVGELYKVGAALRQGEAALRAAEAQERMADVLASLEHGGAAVALLARLREMPGEVKPLPFRRLTPMPKPTGEGA